MSGYFYVGYFFFLPAFFAFFVSFLCDTPFAIDFYRLIYNILIVTIYKVDDNM
jgi:hypothetical protein